MTIIRHCGIVVRDMEISIAFYQKYFGFKIESQNIEEGPFLEEILGLPGGRVKTVKLRGTAGSQLELLAFDFPESFPPRSLVQYGPTHLALTVPNISMIYKRMLKANIEITSPPRDAPNGDVKVMFCRDPDKTWLELVEEMR